MRILQVLIPLIVRDRTRLGALFVSAVVAVAGVASIRLAGVELSEQQNVWITTASTFVFSYIIEVIGSEANVKGVKKIQEANGVNPDGYAGPVTVAAVEDSITGN